MIALVTARRSTLLSLSALVAAALLASLVPSAQAGGKGLQVRFSTFNASLNRFSQRELVEDLSSPNDPQAQAVAEIIQRIRPDVLVINEFDFDSDEEAARLFQENYLSISQNGADPIEYPHVFQAPSNTGIASGFDLNNDGVVGTQVGTFAYADDAFGFGFFPGQFGMLVLSRYPIDQDGIRSFQLLLWKDMPGALLPIDPVTGESWYSEEELEAFRLSSKSHWDAPVQIGAQTVHFLVSHPTPPVFDGPEDRNGRRNHDEIRFWADYVDPARSAYIYDDQGSSGGLAEEALFVIAGDQNADPLDGDSVPGAIQQLLEHPAGDTRQTPSSGGAVVASRMQGGANLDHESPAVFDTADFNDQAPGNLRVDYVLPRRHGDLEMVGSAVFWPPPRHPLFRLVGTFPFPSSDHRLVWVDVLLRGS